MNHDGLILRMGAMTSRDLEVPDTTVLHFSCYSNHHRFREEPSLRKLSNLRPPTTTTQPTCQSSSSFSSSPILDERTNMLMDRTIPEYIFILTDESDDGSTTSHPNVGVGTPSQLLLPMRHGNSHTATTTTTTTTNCSRKNAEHEPQLWQKRGRFLIWPAHLGDRFDSLSN
jgi:hypothetical protein